MSEELIEEIDWEGSVVAVHPKSKLKQSMFPHKVSLIIPKTHGDKYILSKRAEDQFPYPGTWVCAVGGKLAVEESYMDAALRESKEEVGIPLKVEFVTSFKYNKPDYMAIFNVYTTKEHIDIKDLKPNKNEVQYLKAFSLNQIKDDIKKKPETFAPTFISALIAFADAMEK